MAITNISKPSAASLSNVSKPTASIGNSAKPLANSLWGAGSLPWQRTAPWLASDNDMANASKPS